MSIVAEIPVKIKWTWEYDPIEVAYTVYLLGAIQYLMYLLREGNNEN